MIPATIIVNTTITAKTPLNATMSAAMIKIQPLQYA